MAKWTLADMPDLTGRAAVVTGANSGLGLVTARELARRGARVVMAVRSPDRGEAAATKVRSSGVTGSVEVARLDLADLASIESFAEALDADSLDLLVNNAGLMALPRQETRDGFEMQFGVNHLGHFALTGRLLDRLNAAASPRVVTVSSGAHRIGKMNWEDLHGRRRYRRWGAYGQSKLANLLFARELDRRARAAGLALKSVAAHPGYASTELQHKGPREDGSRIGGLLATVGNRVLAQSDADGALPSLYAATADVPGGTFAGPDGFLEQRGKHPKLVGSTGAAQDAEAARRLWDVSERETGVSYLGS